MIEGADHRLSEPLHRLQALERSRQWFLRYLGGAAVSGS
jgi:dipeptidyl aminopeptidase/acylaminoacyl peptidase